MTAALTRSAAARSRSCRRTCSRASGAPSRPSLEETFAWVKAPAERRERGGRQRRSPVGWLSRRSSSSCRRYSASWRHRCLPLAYSTLAQPTASSLTADTRVASFTSTSTRPDTTSPPQKNVLVGSVKTTSKVLILLVMATMVLVRLSALDTDTDTDALRLLLACKQTAEGRFYTPCVCSCVAPCVNSHPIGGKALFVSAPTNQRPRWARGHGVAMRERLVVSSCAGSKQPSGDVQLKQGKISQKTRFNVHRTTRGFNNLPAGFC